MKINDDLVHPVLRIEGDGRHITPFWHRQQDVLHLQAGFYKAL
jgi:hypothetical protein